jgi:hypothetical protein
MRAGLCERIINMPHEGRLEGVPSDVVWSEELDRAGSHTMSAHLFRRTAILEMGDIVYSKSECRSSNTVISGGRIAE